MARPVSTDLRIAALRVRGASRRAAARVRHGWRRSLHLRVVITTLVLSATVVTVLGYVLMTRVTSGLLDAKERSSVEETRAEKRAAQQAEKRPPRRTK